MANDAVLGKEIHDLLVSKGIETPMGGVPIDPKEDQDAIEKAVRDIMECLNLDMRDDSLKDTPARVAKMFCTEIFEGLDYSNFPAATVIENKMGYDEVVLVRDIVVRSCCEHHLQGIYGKAHIAYIPDKKVIGLSKFARIVDFFASRPQVQERLTEQVYACLAHVLGTDDVAVIIDCEHFCMKMRGVQDACSSTVTSKMCGRFRTNSDARQELLSLIRI